MKHSQRNYLGVTLLEIMLVLAIAAMIIVMSIRYYASATSSQQANAILEQIQGITAAADSLAQGTGTYSSLSTSTVASIMPAKNGMTQPWGGSITITAGTSSFTMTLTEVPIAVCPVLVSRLKANTKYTPGSCTSNAVTPTLAIVYTATN